jgi:anaerobic magnesium-protoporphyrin IX monomethyl ester cyclase
MPSLKPVALVMPPCWSETAPPLGLGFIARTLEAHGFSYVLFELNIQAYQTLDRKDLWNPALQRCWTDEQIFREETLPLFADFLERSAETIAAGDFLAVGLSVFSSSRRFAVKLAERLRELRPELVLIWGGPAVHTEQELAGIPSNLVDAAVIGEGEETMLELVDHLAAGRPLPQDLSGTAVPFGPRYHFNPRRAEIVDLDQIPYPTYDQFPLESYGSHQHHAMLLGRGCPMRCAFCDTSGRFRRFRCRSAESVMDELAFHSSQRRINSVTFFDASINGNPRTLRRLVDRLAAWPHRLRWMANFVVQRRWTEERYQAMARAGCFRLFYGVESGSDRVLKLMNKHYTAEEAGRALRWGHEAGIENLVNFICGFPGETEEDFEETLRFVERNRPYLDTVAMVTLMFIVPETPVYLRRHELGITLGRQNHFYWRDTQGNTIEVRRARLVRLSELLGSFGIPILASSLSEVDINYGRRSKTADEDQTLEVRSPIHIRNVQLFDEHGRRMEHCRPGGSFDVVLDYEASRAVEAPVVRVQLFNNENPSRRNVLVFGTNTARFDPPLGTLPAGRGAVRLHVARLNLGPGFYPLTTGIWPDEASEEPFDVQHGEPLLSVDGARLAAVVGVQLDAELQINPGPRGLALAGDRLGAGGLEVRDGQAQTGQPMRLRMPVVVNHPSQILLAASIAQGDLTLRLDEWRRHLYPGSYLVEITYRSLNLLAGDYDVALALAVGDSDACTARTRLEVQSRRSDGAGIVYCPAEFILESA